MTQSGDPVEKQVLIEQISEFCLKSSGLRFCHLPAGDLEISQQVDGKSIPLKTKELEDVITRFDSDGRLFLQVNFLSGRKILLTDQLIGFRPADCVGIDAAKLPRVVTTPDLVSIVEAMQELLASDTGTNEEFEVLRKVFYAVIDGGEGIGFDLSGEKNWLARIHPNSRKSIA